MRFLSGDERGSILVVTLVVLCILSLFCVQLGRNVRGKLSLVARLEGRDRLRRAAGNGAKDGVSFLVPEGEMVLGEGIATIYLGNEQKLNWGYEHWDRLFRVESAYIDEESKINVNKADTKVMAKLFEAVGEMDEDSATELAYCVADWRDRDSFLGHPQYGAEDGDYKRASHPYEAKDAPFEVLEELVLVNGMDQERYERLRDYLTVYGSGKVNINNASAPVLQALGLPEPVVTAIEEYRLRHDPAEDRWSSVRFVDVNTIVSQLGTVARLKPEEVAALQKVIATGMFITDSAFFAVRSVGTSVDGRMVCQVVSVVSRRDGRMRYWREELGSAETVRLWRARGE